MRRATMVLLALVAILIVIIGAGAALMGNDQGEGQGTRSTGENNSVTPIDQSSSDTSVNDSKVSQSTDQTPQSPQSAEPIKPSSSKNDASASDAAPSSAQAVKQIANTTLSGSGDSVTNKFDLASGIAIFNMSYSGESNFAVKLYTAEGEYVDLLANEIGSYTGSTLVGVAGEVTGAAQGQHYLDVTASGPWTVVIEQPKVSSAPSIPVTLSGKGADVPTAFTLPSGAVKFTMTHQGSSNFAVTLYDADGKYVELLANDIGHYGGSKSVSVDGSLLGTSPGIHYLKVEADGIWNIQVSKV